MNLLFVFLLCSLSATYVVRILLFDGSIGPFENRSAIVVDGTSQIGHPDIFDRIRSLFGFYQKIESKDGIVFWHVNYQRSLVWRCPKCLGFWVSLIFSVVFMLSCSIPVWAYPLVVLSMSYIVAFNVFLFMRLEPGDE